SRAAAAEARAAEAEARTDAAERRAADAGDPAGRGEGAFEEEEERRTLREVARAAGELAGWLHRLAEGRPPKDGAPVPPSPPGEVRPRPGDAPSPPGEVRPRPDDAPSAPAAPSRRPGPVERTPPRAAPP